MQKTSKYVTMIIGTSFAGFVFGILAAFLMALLLQDGDGWGGLIGAVLGLAFGYPFGVFIGILFFKKKLRYEGSLLFGLIGTVVGGVLPFALAEPLGLNNYTDLLWAFIILSAPILSTIGFNLKKDSAK
jgi:hypothetical protein